MERAILGPPQTDDFYVGAAPDDLHVVGEG